MTSRPSIAFGPESNKPSWDWVGFDVGRELSKYFDIKFFPHDIKEVPQSDLVFFIKNKPHEELWRNARHRSVKMVYCPIDYYQQQSMIESQAMFLEQCEAIIVHCERLLPIFAHYCRKVEYIEHHNRFGLPNATDYKPSGYAVWIGGYQNLPPVIKWLRRHPLGFEIKFVTDHNVRRKYRLINVLAIKDRHEVLRWSPRVQRDVMASAKVALDIKGLDFNEMHKPPVKAQSFIASGIPFATNPESYSAEYFMTRGFQIASPEEVHHWLSLNYWERTKTAGEELRGRLTLENVGLHYKRLIESIL
jgi:hypothetical protein